MHGILEYGWKKTIEGKSTDTEEEEEKCFRLAIASTNNFYFSLCLYQCQPNTQLDLTFSALATKAPNTTTTTTTQINGDCSVWFGFYFSLFCDYFEPINFHIAIFSRSNKTRSTKAPKRSYTTQPRWNWSPLIKIVFGIDIKWEKCMYMEKTRLRKAQSFHTRKKRWMEGGRGIKHE